jgi:hypothetical protein
MAFIEKKDPVVLNIMLTSLGRKQLSSGNLTFKYYGIGDSEIDYNFIREISGATSPAYSPFNSSILRPRDANPRLLSIIPRTTGTTSGNTNYYTTISTVAPITYDVVNNARNIGFFSISGNSTEFIIDSNHVKQPDIMIYMSGITGGSTLNLRKSPSYGTSGYEPNVGDYLFVRWTFTGNTLSFLVDKSTPTPYLMYQIKNKIGGTLMDNNLKIVVDRNLPDFSGATGKAGALVYYSGLTSYNQQATDYLSKSTLDFLQNYECGINEFPFWNMSIVFTDEIIGIQNGNRTFGQFNSRTYGGFVSYIQNQAPKYKKLGIIHYSNSSPANTYGEEFQGKEQVLSIPTIMWHKSTNSELGVTLIPTGSSKQLTGITKSLNITYYDLADTNGNIVGKVFGGLKVFVIEDQELLFAMSYKSNRSWTLPNYVIGTGSNSPCN